MPRYVFLTLLCLSPLAHAATMPSADAAHDLSYSMGASLGERLREEVPELQLQALIEGLRTAYQGQPLALSDERIEQILTLHQAQSSQAQPQSEMALGAERDFLLKEKQQPQARELADGIVLLELKHGTGAKPGAQDSVYVNYVGRLPGWHSLRPKHPTSMVSPGQRYRRLAQCAGPDAGRREVATGNTFKSGLRHRGRRRFDRPLHTPGV